tara:strand:+ start:1768 stop:2550 length:783 start_codon:yes stop_codon:yes gene_type:complete
MKKCKNYPSILYTGKEKSPKGRGYCAKGEKIGTKKKGRNGKMYIVKKDSIDRKRWVKIVPKKTKTKGKKVMRGGSLQDDADKITDLIFTKEPIDTTHTNLSSYHSGVRIHTITQNYEDFFTHVGANRFDIAPTDKLKQCINTLNTRGQSILYVAFRFGNYSLCRKILETPGIDVNIQNEDGSTAIVGAAFDKRTISEIMQHLQLYMENNGNISIGAEKTVETTDAEGKKVFLEITENPFSILDLRVRGHEGYPELELVKS